MHVCLVPTDICQERKLLSQYATLLDATERHRFGQLDEEGARNEFLITRALCRVMLSQFADRSPCAWRFESGPHGRPRIPGGDGASSIEFNLSNSKGLVACVVGIACKLGIDVEPLVQDRRAEAMTRRFFATPEIAFVTAAPPAERIARFLQLWTLKEAFVKARGEGMTLPFNAFAFDIGQEPIVVQFLDPAIGEPLDWRFHAWHAKPGHRVALALGTDNRERTFHVTVYCAIPRLQGGRGYLEQLARQHSILLSVPLSRGTSPPTRRMQS